MFSLKLDVLFPTLAMAKELVRKLNSGSTAPPHDPREVQRIRAELQAARERLELQSIWHRNRIL